MVFLIDVDEVLAEFTKAVKQITLSLGSELPEPTEWSIFDGLDPKLLPELYKGIEAPGFCASLEICPGSQEGVRKLRSLGCDIYALTSPWVGSPTWCHERMEWLNNHFSIDSKHVVFTHTKAIVAGRFFLDDKPENVTSWGIKNSQGVSMLWHTERNFLPGYEEVRGRVRSWKQVVGVVLQETHGRFGG